MASELLNESDYKKILETHLKTTNFEFISGDLKPISENQEGFMGEHYKLNIKYKINNTTETSQFFLKTKPTTNKMLANIVEETFAYDREIFIYDFLIPEFIKLGFDCSFAPYCYHCIPAETLVLEDITLNGFELHPRGVPYSLGQIKAVLKSLALLHAASFAYEQEQKKMNEDFSLGDLFKGKMKELFFIPDEKFVFMKNWWDSTFKSVDLLIDLLSLTEEQKKHFKSLLKTTSMEDVFTTETKFARTYGHGDLWSNNMMFHSPKSVTPKCSLLDFQIGRYFYPAFDVQLAIFINTNLTLRNSHLPELYQFYYTSLEEILSNYGYAVGDLIPLDDFKETLELIKYEALMQGIAFKLFTLMPAEDVTESMKKHKDASPDETYDEELQMLVDYFNNDAIYRQEISEHLEDIYKALVERSTLR